VKPRIRLLALDIDGTLIGEDLLLRERTVAAVRAAVDHGVSVSLCTGRMASSALQFAHQLGLTEPLVAYQGALIREMPPRGSTRPGRLRVHTPLRADVAREVVAWAIERGLDPHVNHLERFIIAADDPNTQDYSAFLGARAEIVPDLAAAIERPVSKILGVGDEGRIAAAYREAQERFAGRAAATVSHPRFLEILAPGATKARGVAWLARRAGVPLAEVMAIGDQRNDLEMLSVVGHGVAMPSAPDRVLEVARYVAPPLEEEGAAQMIERLILGGRPS
jgi:Cof subfamily protein (haloacid dehalogenase superfamily)